MGEIDISKTRKVSTLAGLADVGEPQTASLVIPSFTIPGAGQYRTYTFNLPMPQNNLIPLIRVQLLGLGTLSNYWYPVQPGATLAYGGYNNITINIFSSGSASGRTISVTVVNQTNGSVSFPGCTVNAVARLYRYPWKS